MKPSLHARGCGQAHPSGRSNGCVWPAIGGGRRPPERRRSRSGAGRDPAQSITQAVLATDAQESPGQSQRSSTSCGGRRGTERARVAPRQAWRPPPLEKRPLGRGQRPAGHDKHPADRARSDSERREEQVLRRYLGQRAGTRGAVGCDLPDSRPASSSRLARSVRQRAGIVGQMSAIFEQMGSGKSPLAPLFQRGEGWGGPLGGYGERLTAAPPPAPSGRAGRARPR